VASGGTNNEKSENEATNHTQNVIVCVWRATAQILGTPWIAADSDSEPVGAEYSCSQLRGVVVVDGGRVVFEA